MECFYCSIPQNIYFGSGSLDKLSEAALALKCKKIYLISGPHLARIGLAERCAQALLQAGIESEVFSETEGNPCTETVEKAYEGYRKSGADGILALGGGSPMDVAKAVAVLAAYGGKITDYEGVGKVPGPVVPMIAIPTTAGTGSEVTSFSVITDHSRNYKLTVGSRYLLPAYAILDPDLIKSVPAKTAAACGVDALVHALESYLSKAGNTFTDMFALRALELIGSAIRAYVADRSDIEAAEKMLLGSLFAGIAFSSARLGNVHAMSHPVSAFFDVPHGMANAILLPVVVDFNEEADTGKYYEIYRAVAKQPGRRENFQAGDLGKALRELNQELGIPGSLKDVGVKPEYFGAMTEDAMKSGNVAVNPRHTEKEDICRLYQLAYGYEGSNHIISL